MKRSYYIIFLLVIFIDCQNNNKKENFDSKPLNAELIYTIFNEVVVTIYTYDSRQNLIGQGSGVVLKDKDFLVTNFHIFEGADSLIVKHKGKIVQYSMILGFDGDIDILILKIAENSFPKIHLGAIDKLKIGQTIYAIGSPMGLENTITEGIISGLRNNDASTRNFIQISAPVSKGSSGGAIVNIKGELIGISTLIFKEGQNLNFAIPIYDIYKVGTVGDSSENIQKALNYYIKGYNSDFSHNYNKAIKYYKKAITFWPEYELAYTNLGNTYGRMGDYKNAIINYKKAIVIKSDFPNAYYNLAVVYERMKDYDLALSNYKKLIEINPQDAYGYNSLATCYYMKSEYDLAIFNYKKVIELNSRYQDAYFNLGVCYYAKRDYNSAIKNYKKSIEIDPQNFKAYNNLGITYNQIGDYENANYYYGRAKQLNKK